jgi:hypothetical protein
MSETSSCYFDQGPFCCSNTVFDSRASSCLLSDYKQAKIRTFIDSVINNEVVYVVGEPNPSELANIDRILKVNIYSFNLQKETQSWFYAPAGADEEGISYYGVISLEKAQTQQFDAVGEGSYLTYWCKEHKHRVRVGVFDKIVRDKDGDVKWASFRDDRIDKLRGVGGRKREKYLGYEKRFWCD